MAKPNYQFEKRQKELAKKRKKEEKRQQKLNKNNAGADAETGSAEAASPGFAADTPPQP